MTLLAAVQREHDYATEADFGLLPMAGPQSYPTELTQPIPAAVLRLLVQAWQRTNGVSEFEAGFSVARPSNERYVHAAKSDNPESAFTFAEVEDLHASGIFDGLSHGTECLVAVNVHAEHALADFCSEVYEAWDRLQDRLEAARAVAARTPCPDSLDQDAVALRQG